MKYYVLITYNIAFLFHLQKIYIRVSDVGSTNNGVKSHR